MNVHQIDRKKLLDHLRAIEEKFPLHFVGLLPRGTVAHVSGDGAVDLLAEKLPGLSLTSLTSAEIDLSAQLQRLVGIVLKSELKGREKEEVPVEPNRYEPLELELPALGIALERIIKRSK